MADFPSEPTGEQCSAEERLPDFNGRPAFACWHPQMGGYVSKAVVVLEGDDRSGGCFGAYVWHDGQFPFSDDCDHGRSPAYIHHCMASQFVEFGHAVQRMQGGSEWITDWEEIDDDAKYVVCPVIQKNGKRSLAQPVGTQAGWEVKQLMAGCYAALECPEFKEQR